MYDEDDWHPDHDDTDDPEGDEEWRPGTCDNCAGDSGQAERAAQMASAIIPVCACAIGQGAPPGQCHCGPATGERFVAGTGVHW